jgi:hypothetical protein
MFARSDFFSSLLEPDELAAELPAATHGPDHALGQSHEPSDGDQGFIPSLI